MIRKEIREHVLYLYKTRLWTQKELAELMGISQASVSRIIYYS